MMTALRPLIRIQPSIMAHRTHTHTHKKERDSFKPARRSDETANRWHPETGEHKKGVHRFAFYLLWDFCHPTLYEELGGKWKIRMWQNTESFLKLILNLCISAEYQNKLPPF